MEAKTFAFKSHMPGQAHLRKMEWAAPERIFSAFTDKPGFIWLDSAMDSTRQGRWSFMMWRPRKTISGSQGEFFHSAPDQATRKIDDPFEMVRDILSVGASPPSPDAPPFTGGVAGFFGYGLAARLEPSLRLSPRPSAAEGEIWIGVYNQVAAFDNRKRELILIARPDDNEGPEDTLDGMEREIDEALSAPGMASAVASKAPVIISNFTHHEYIDAVERVRRYIERGDCYQVNIAQRFTLEDTFGDDLYTKLRDINPAPFGAYLNTGSAMILSVSPERFIRLENGKAKTSPIKGTRPRGRSPAEDRLIGLELLESEKDRAENVMIVDLLRNDFSRVCLPHSVTTPSICALERHPTVHHLVSTVEGTLKPGLGAVDLIQNAFPGGSVTGAPKIRAMEVIDEIEPDPRGAYCGAIGYMGFDGAMDTSVVIRTMIRAKGKITFHAGGGITWPSDPGQEYQETMDKAKALIEVVSQ